MTTHIVECPCGWKAKVDGWLDALELARLHERRGVGHDAVIELNLTRRHQ